MECGVGQACSSASPSHSTLVCQFPAPQLLPILPGNNFELVKSIVFEKQAELDLVGGKVEESGAPAKELLDDRPVELGDAGTGYMHKRERDV